VGDPVELGGDVVAGATALAGLILVYIGSVAVGYGTYERQAQATVRSSFQFRAWFAFAGMTLAILAGMLGLVGKWLHNSCVAAAAIILLLLALVWGIIVALFTVREIR
jgi:hypothetical protein